MPIYWEIHWENIYWSYSICLIFYGNTNSYSLQISLKMNLTMNEVVFDKNTNTTMALNYFYSKLNNV